MAPKTAFITALLLVSRLSPAAPTLASRDARGTADTPFEPPTARFRFDAGAPLVAPAGVAPDGALCVGTADGYIHVLDADGRYRWSYSVHGAVNQRPLFVEPLWYVATSAERIYALTRQGALYWVFKPPSPVDSALAADDTGRVFFVAANRFLYGVSGHGGIALRVPFGEPGAGPESAADGAIWVENTAGRRIRARATGFQFFEAADSPVAFSFSAPGEVRDPDNHEWRAHANGRLEFSSAPGARPSSAALTDAPLLSPVWSRSARYLVVSARNGLVMAVDPPRAVTRSPFGRQSR